MSLLDGLLIPDEATDRTPLTWLRQGEVATTPTAILSALERRATLIGWGLDRWDLQALHPNRLKFLARLGKRSTNQALQRAPAERRYPILVAFLRQALEETTDEVIDLFDRCLARASARADRKLEEFRLASAETTDEAVRFFGQIGRIVLDPTVADRQLRAAIYRQVARETLREAVERTEALSRRGVDHEFGFLADRYNYLRQFTPQFLDAFTFQSNRAGAPILEAVARLRGPERPAAAEGVARRPGPVRPGPVAPPRRRPGRRDRSSLLRAVRALGTPGRAAGRQRLAGDQPPVRRPRDVPDLARAMAPGPPGPLPPAPAPRGRGDPIEATPGRAGGGADSARPGLAAERRGADRGGSAGAHPALGRGAARRVCRVAGEDRPTPPPGRPGRPAPRGRWLDRLHPPLRARRRPGAPHQRSAGAPPRLDPGASVQLRPDHDGRGRRAVLPPAGLVHQLVPSGGHPPSGHRRGRRLPTPSAPEPVLGRWHPVLLGRSALPRPRPEPHRDRSAPLLRLRPGADLLHLDLGPVCPVRYQGHPGHGPRRDLRARRDPRQRDRADDPRAHDRHGRLHRSGLRPVRPAGHAVRPRIRDLGDQRLYRFDTGATYRHLGRCSRARSASGGSSTTGTTCCGWPAR